MKTRTFLCSLRRQIRLSGFLWRWVCPWALQVPSLGETTWAITEEQKIWLRTSEWGKRPCSVAHWTWESVKCHHIVSCKNMVSHAAVWRQLFRASSWILPLEFKTWLLAQYHEASYIWVSSWIWFRIGDRHLLKITHTCNPFPIGCHGSPEQRVYRVGRFCNGPIPLTRRRLQPITSNWLNIEEGKMISEGRPLYSLWVRGGVGRA